MCVRTPAPLKPFRARGHWNSVCLCGLGILGSANCSISQHWACVTVSFHCPLWLLFTGWCVILWEATMKISSEVKLRGLSYQSKSLANSCGVCLVKPISSWYLICFYLRYLAVKRQRTIAVRLRPLSAILESLKRYFELDFSSLSRVLDLLLDCVRFSARTFQSGVTLKIIDMANVFTTVSAVALNENNRWFKPAQLWHIHQWNQPNQCSIKFSMQSLHFADDRKASFHGNKQMVVTSNDEAALGFLGSSFFLTLLLCLGFFLLFSEMSTLHGRFVVLGPSPRQPFGL